MVQGDTDLDVWRYAAQVTAQRLVARPIKKVETYPHQITVETGQARYEHRHRLPEPEVVSVHTDQ